MTTHLPIVLPPGITCPDWKEREPGKKRCAYYLAPSSSAPSDGATCNINAHFLCVEWVLANAEVLPPATVSRIRESIAQRASLPLDTRSGQALPTRPPEAAHSAPSAPEAPALQTDLFGGSVSPPAQPAQAAPNPPPQRLTPPQAPLPPAKEIPASDVAELEALGYELELASLSNDKLKFFLVPRHTKQDRIELSFREAATLRLIVDAFPGARMLGLVKASPRDREDTSLSLDDFTHTACPDCGESQLRCPQGITCPNGHGYGDVAQPFPKKARS